MQNSSGGAAFATISSGLIANLPITLLPLEKQRIIGKVMLLSEREQNLISKLAEEKKKYKKLKKIYQLPDMRTAEEKEADFGKAFW